MKSVDHTSRPRHTFQAGDDKWNSCAAVPQSLLVDCLFPADVESVIAGQKDDRVVRVRTGIECIQHCSDLIFSAPVVKNGQREPGVYRVDVNDDSISKIAAESVTDLEFNPDGTLLYASQIQRRRRPGRVISIDPASGAVKAIAVDVSPSRLAVTKDDKILFTQFGKREIFRVDPKSGEVTAIDTDMTLPNGIALSNDGGTLAVSDYGGAHTWTFRVNSGGVLDATMPTMPMRLPIDSNGKFDFNEEPPYVKASGGIGAAIDRRGRYYVTSDLGVQIFDPTGRPCGVLPKVDADQPLSSCMLAGKNHNTLFIAHGVRLYKRKLTVDRPKR